jgi:hypothetical protein
LDISSLDPDKKRTISESIYKISNAYYTVTVDDFTNILNLLGKNEHKLAVIKYFVPRISLEDAKKY